jgi:hypothetical protein
MLVALSSGVSKLKKPPCIVIRYALRSATAIFGMKPSVIVSLILGW